MKTFLKNNYHYIAMIIIAVVSYMLYSYRYYHLLNGDDAMIVMMAHYFDFPKDMFFWFQSRGGSIIPMFAQVFMFLGLDAINAVSLATYIILFVGVLCFSSLFKNRLSKIMLCLLWFLPFQRFIDITRFYIGYEYAVLAIAVFLINKIWDMDKTKLKTQIMMLLCFICLVASIWVLYNALFSIIIMFVVLFFYADRKPHKNVVIFTLAGIVAGTLILKYIYSFNNAWCDDCNKINDIQKLWQSITKLWGIWTAILLFKTKEYIVGIHAWLCIVFFATNIVVFTKNKYYKTLIKDKWIMFFFLDFCAFFGIYLLSRWVYLNEMGRWYYVACYISASLWTLLCFDRLWDEEKLKHLKKFLFIIVFIGALTPVINIGAKENSSNFHLTRKDNKPFRSVYSYAKELDKLGSCGIIADWWSAYPCAIANPNNIVAAPHQDDWLGVMRNPDLCKKAASMETVYLIKDQWMNSYPDTITQFDNFLIKDGEPFDLGLWNMCRYKHGVAHSSRNAKE